MLTRICWFLLWDIKALYASGLSLAVSWSVRPCTSPMCLSLSAGSNTTYYANCLLINIISSNLSRCVEMQSLHKLHGSNMLYARDIWITERVNVNERTFGKLQNFAIVLAVSGVRFNSDEYMAAGLASLDSQRATLTMKSNKFHIKNATPDVLYYLHS